MTARLLIFNHRRDLLQQFYAAYTAEGYDVHISIQSPTELRALERLDPDLILLGHINGEPDNDWSMIEVVRELTPLKSVPILVYRSSLVRMTATLPESPRVTVAYVSEPLAVRDLLPAVQDILNEVPDTAL